MVRKHRSALDSSIWRAVAWLGVLLMAAAAAVVSVAQQWTGTWTILAFMLASIGFLLKISLPSAFGALFVFGSVLNAAGWALGWFQLFVWYDEFVHALTAFAGISSLGYLSAAARRGSSHALRGRLVLLCAGMGLVLGLAWEVIEALFVNLQPIDTVLDIVFDLTGAVLGGFFARASIDRDLMPAR